MCAGSAFEGMTDLVILQEAGGQGKATVVSLKSLDSHDYVEFDLDKWISRKMITFIDVSIDP